MEARLSPPRHRQHQAYQDDRSRASSASAVQASGSAIWQSRPTEAQLATLRLLEGQAAGECSDELGIDNVDRAVSRSEALEVDVGRIAGVFDDDVHQHAVGLTVLFTAWIDVLLGAVEVANAGPLEQARSSLPGRAVVAIAQLGLQQVGAGSQVQVRHRDTGKRARGNVLEIAIHEDAAASAGGSLRPGRSGRANRSSRSWRTNCSSWANGSSGSGRASGTRRPDLSSRPGLVPAHQRLVSAACTACVGVDNPQRQFTIGVMLVLYARVKYATVGYIRQRCARHQHRGSHYHQTSDNPPSLDHVAINSCAAQFRVNDVQPSSALTLNFT